MRRSGGGGPRKGFQPPKTMTSLQEALSLPQVDEAPCGSGLTETAQITSDFSSPPTSQRLSQNSKSRKKRLRDASHEPPPDAAQQPPLSVVVEACPGPEMTMDDLLAVEAEIEEDSRRSVDIAFTQRSLGSSMMREPSVRLTPVPKETEPTFYGLPMTAERLFRQRGVRQLYEWQDHVLQRNDVKAGRNFVYSLPTSGGKTLVAEIMLLRCLILRQKTALFVLPFVSVAEEKFAALQPFGEHFGFPVDGYYGTNGRFPLPKAPGIYVCTIEKANSLFNHLCEEGRTAEVGLVVVDELHMVGEPRRGATLELFLTKVMTVNPSDTQIVGMSATVPNLEVLADWLQAVCYICDYRPVPLKQYAVCEGVVLENGVTNVSSLPSPNDHDALLHLVSEFPESSSLVFCASRQQTVDTAKQIVKGLARLYQWSRKRNAEQLLEDLRSIGHNEFSPLSETMPFGVAFHHGGLLMEERALIERAYRAKQVTILCCTSTLAAGVNLPARRVIFKTPYVGRDFLTKSRYLQMCGRAGRAGLDAFGESFLILKRRDRAKGHELIRQDTEPTRSVLLDGPEGEQGLSRSLLECCAVNVFGSLRTAMFFAKKLLCNTEVNPTSNPGWNSIFEGKVLRAIGALQEIAFISVAPATSDHTPTSTAPFNISHFLQQGMYEAESTPALKLQPTPFGQSSVRSCFSLEEALLVKHELSSLQEEGLILCDDLHTCYFLTPVREVPDSIDWAVYQRLLSRLSTPRQRIAERLGVDEYFVDQCAMGLMTPTPAPSASASSLLSSHEMDLRKRLFTTRRFYVALMLSDLLNEMAMQDVEAKYTVNRGQLQSLLKSASMFSVSITAFCNAMGWFSLEAVLSSFVKRLGYGVRPDIVPLMEIQGVQPPRARALWNAGFRDAGSIAACTPQQLLERVKKTNPADSKAAKFFTIRSAVSVVREATKWVHQQMKEKRSELVELSLRSTQRLADDYWMNKETPRVQEPPLP
jgi:replicative superfamily II helicase